jgi:hypothetical protein
MKEGFLAEALKVTGCKFARFLSLVPVINFSYTMETRKALLCFHVLVLAVCVLFTGCANKQGGSKGDKVKKEESAADSLGFDQKGTNATDGLSFVIGDVLKKHHLDFELVPIDIPEYLENSADPEIKKIISLINLFNYSRRLSFRPDSLKIILEDENILPKLTPVALFQNEEPTIQCINNVDGTYICTYTWYENNGKLAVIFTDENIGDHYYSSILFDGEDSGGRHYDNFLIEEWIMEKDPSKSVHYYNQMIEPCQFGRLFTWITEVLDSGRLYFQGEEKRVHIYKYTIQTSNCFPCNMVYAIYPRTQLVCIHYPDNKFILEQWILDIQRCVLYRWIKYVITPDKAWNKTVYDKDGRIIDFTTGEA